MKCKCKQKFIPKIFVWLALSSKGISTPYIGTTKVPAVTSNVYIEKCFPKLLHFINKHHLDDKYIFWPDLTSSQYAKQTTKWFEEQKIPFVPKCANLPNVRKARPINDFWSILADKVYTVKSRYSARILHVKFGHYNEMALYKVEVFFYPWKA